MEDRIADHRPGVLIQSTENTVLCIHCLWYTPARRRWWKREPSHCDHKECFEIAKTGEKYRVTDLRWLNEWSDCVLYQALDMVWARKG